MTGLDLRPLTLGEILDRTFTLYRSHFVLFLGITGISQALILATQLSQMALEQYYPSSFGISSLPGVAFILVLAVVTIVAYLFSQGGAVIAVSEIYLGREITIAESLQRVRGNLGALFGVVLLYGLAVIGASILLIIPGIYVACRLLVNLPAALIEERGPSDALSRSWELTRGFAGRAFVIFLLYAVIAFAANLLFVTPFSIGVATSLKNPSGLWFWAALIQVGSRAAAILTQPILLIATAIFYYDLRVRKEAFDLQFMMNPSAPPSAGPGSVPSIL
jgi:hypothetical protein